MANPLYGDPDKWDGLMLWERLEFIRQHSCTGPCGQSSQVMTQRERMNQALREAVTLVKAYTDLGERLMAKYDHMATG